jgi:hypothetical protein
MSRCVRLCALGCLLLVALAGCGRYFFAQRDPWRKEAELACLKSGQVKESEVLVRVEPISGPGTCGAEYPLKVVALGEASSAMGYSGNLRPPGGIPGNGGQQGIAQPNWPAQEPRYNNPYGQQQYLSAPPRISAPQTYDPQGEASVQTAPLSISPPQGRRPSVYDPPPARAQSVPLSQQPQFAAAAGPVALKPTATLACPIVSALDQWLANAVQPAAQRWFGLPVTEIRQISAYSCRGMNGQAGARISEHAFGNALDIASFILADGRKITVKGGWRGTPEEQGFLRDVQGAACEHFTTVLAPGSNRFHYDHIHVDLMRRASGRSICNPDAVSGEVVAARAAQERGYALGRNGGATGSLGAKIAPKLDKTATAKNRPKLKKFFQPEDDDDDWVEDDGPRGRAN